MNLKKVTALALVGAMALSLAACGSTGTTASTAATGAGASGSAASAAAAATSSDTTGTVSGAKGANQDAANTTATDETLTIGLASEPSALWGAPVGKTENEAQIIFSALTDRLVKVDHTTGEVKPDLATSWEWVDSKHCKFNLRTDVTMTDGTPLTADDVVYSVSVWTGASANTDTGRFIDAATTKADDDHTVTIGFNTPAPDLLSMLDWSNFGIVSEDEVNAAGGAEAAANNPVLGSGKYKFKEWKRGQSITLERNDNYWDKDWKGYYKTIVFTFTSDAAARAMAVQSGDSQVAYDMPVSQASTYLASTDVQTVMYTFGQVGHLWYNMSDGHDATQNQKVREAIDKALDYDAIAQVGTAGTGKAALGYFDTDSKYYNQTYTEDERKVDVEGAKALLKEAGYESGLELTAIGLQDVVPVYTVMQENLRAVGITLNIKTTDTAQFVQDAFGGNYDIIDVGELTDARYPTLLPFLRSANIASGYVIGGPKATTDAIDSAIETAIEETDEAKAKEELGAIEQTMKEQTIVSNLYPEMHASVIAKDLKGYTTIERGFMDPTNFYK